MTDMSCLAKYEEQLQTPARNTRSKSKKSSRKVASSGDDFDSKLKKAFDIKETEFKEAVEEWVLALVPRMEKHEDFKYIYSIMLELDEVNAITREHGKTRKELCDMICSLSDNLYCVEGYYEGMAYDSHGGRTVVDIFYSKKKDNPEMKRVMKDYT